MTAEWHEFAFDAPRESKNWWFLVRTRAASLKLHLSGVKHDILAILDGFETGQ